MKRIEMKAKDFFMRYPISETVYIADENDKNKLVASEIYSRSLLHEKFEKDSVISFNEFTLKEESEYYSKIANGEAKDNILEMLDVEIDGKKCYGDSDTLDNLNRKEYSEFISALNSFLQGIVAM